MTDEPKDKVLDFKKKPKPQMLSKQLPGLTTVELDASPIVHAIQDLSSAVWGVGVLIFLGLVALCIAFHKGN